MRVAALYSLLLLCGNPLHKCTISFHCSWAFGSFQGWAFINSAALHIVGYIRLNFMYVKLCFKVDTAPPLVYDNDATYGDDT